VVPISGLDTEATEPLQKIEPRSPCSPVRSQTLYWLSYPVPSRPFTLRMELQFLTHYKALDRNNNRSLLLIYTALRTTITFIPILQLLRSIIPSKQK
jgi:hypothetical protein